MLIVDTNILVYAADADSPFDAGCRGWLERQQDALRPGIPCA
jgi:predicted nucleic acid-binding protein